MIELEGIEAAEQMRGVRAERNRVVHAGQARNTSGHRLRRLGALSGWLAAAAVAFFAIDGRFAHVVQQPGTNEASLLPQLPRMTRDDSSSGALREYLRKGNQDGTVIGEMPRKILMQAQPAADGLGYDVVYIRQILERGKVNDLYRFSEDEAGRTTPVLIQPKAGRM